MYKTGEVVKWRRPLDADYSYGTILELNNSIATVRCSGYNAGFITEVHLRYMEKLKRGGKGFGNSKKSSKRSAP